MKRLRATVNDSFFGNAPTGAVVSPASSSKELLLKLLHRDILNLILGHLDSRSLKKARLVCKSWLLEAQRHLETMGLIVRLNGDEGLLNTRVRNFIRTLERKLPGLPQPFHSIDLDQGKVEFLPEQLFFQLENSLLPPVVITRFTPGSMRMSLAIEFLYQHFFSLEYLKMSLDERRNPYEAELIQSLLDPDRSFPQLQHLSLDASKTNSRSPNIRSFVDLVAGIVRASPKLDTFESRSEEPPPGCELSNQLMLAVNIGHVKTLRLDNYRLHGEAFQHFLSYPFHQLQNLSVSIVTYADASQSPDEEALIATLAKCTATLRTLDLYWYLYPEDFPGFPVCPNVQELRLTYFPCSSTFLPDRFPYLQVLTAEWTEVDVLGKSWTSLPPLLGIKTLRLGFVNLKPDGDDSGEELPLKFFEKFPDVERLRLPYSFAVDCCRVRAKGRLNFSRILEGLKHLELDGYHHVGWFEERDEDGNSLFAALNGIETLTLVKPNDNLLLIPFQDMPSLKVLQFPWGACFNEKELVDATRGLEKVFITNCCSFPRTGDPYSSKALDSFLDSAPNAECGCKEWKKI